MVVENTEVFIAHFKGWVERACREWAMPIPDNEYYAKTFHRLPDGVKSWVVKGIQDGIIIEDGYKFRLKGQDPRKGPYSWLSKNRGLNPTCNWEYVVQVAEYVRLFTQYSSGQVRLVFEDKLMDLGNL